MKYVETIPEAVTGISRAYLHIIAAMSLAMNACDQAPIILPKMQDQTLLVLR